MPQMAVGGLSESWLMRELGDMHWTSICQALATASHTIHDALGNRLYATFVRIRLVLEDHLKQFRENDALVLETRLSRFGASMCFSEGLISRGDGGVRGRASLMSSFALRQCANTRLTRAEPEWPMDSPVPDLPALPAFAVDYREMRKELRPSHTLCDHPFGVPGAVQAEMEYVINPYQDFNGVNLLYFAAYPGIVDVCERQFVHRERGRHGIDKDWALESSTLARDTFYYGNCDIDDTLIVELTASELVPRDRLFLAAALRRKSDRKLLCQSFTIKAHHG